MARPGLRLTEQQRTELTEEFRVARGNKDLDMCLRIQALFLVSRGHREVDAAAAIGVACGAVQDWIHLSRKGGLPRLRKGPFEGGKPRLTDQRKSQLSKIVEAGPQEVVLDTGVWTTSIVAKPVKDLFGVSYHPDHVGRILHQLGYSVQYPGKSLSKADENFQRKWLRDELPEIKKSPAGTWCSALRR